MRLLQHVARLGVDQEHEAAQGEVEYAAGGGQPDDDGVRAPASGSEAGDRGRADHTVGLVQKRVPRVQALERYVPVLQRRGDEEQAGGQRHMQGLRQVEASPRPRNRARSGTPPRTARTPAAPPRRTPPPAARRGTADCGRQC